MRGVVHPHLAGPLPIDQVNTSTQNLEQVHAVLQQDIRMKDVFSELDGFIVLVSVLSTLRDGDTPLDEWDRTVVAAFRVMIVALTSHPHNHLVFEVSDQMSAWRRNLN